MATVSGFTAERMLEVENSTVVDADVVGDNLILHTRGGDDIDAGSVRGPQGNSGGLQANELGNAVDLNTLKAAGTWTQSSAAEAAAGTNYPEPQPGILEILANAAGTVVRQTYTVLGTSVWAGVIYTRTFFNNAWLPWIATGGVTPYLNVHKTTPYEFASGTEVTVVFEGVDDLVGGMQYSAGTCTVPRTGKYMINAMAHFQSALTSGNIAWIVRKNASKWRQLNLKQDGANESREINTTLPADAGDTFDIRCSAPATVILYGVAPGIRYTSLDITFVGP